MLDANKKVAVADAKLRAIEHAMIEEETGEKCELPGIPKSEPKERTLDWVQTISEQKNPPKETIETIEPQNLPKESRASSRLPKMSATNPIPPTHQQNLHDSTQHALSQKPVIASTPTRDISGSQLIEC